MRYLFLLLPALLLLSCQKDAPDDSLKAFSDNFESYTAASELVGSSATQWTELNVNEINKSTNPVSIDTSIVHSGNQSVRFEAVQDDAGYTEVAKCNLNKANLDFRQGETMYYSAWYYIEHPDNKYGTFFIWDIGQIAHGSLEIRAMAWEENLELERNKIGLPNLFQESPATLFPVNQWAHFELEIKLSQYRNGSVKMWLDGKELLYHNNIITMPKDHANLVWDTKSYYERVQVGITAKSGTEKLVMYVDDVDMYSKK